MKFLVDVHSDINAKLFTLDNIDSALFSFFDVFSDAVNRLSKLRGRIEHI